jgi:hypothetical protein
MKKQLGVSLSGLIMVCVVVILVLLLGFKVFTPITEYLAIQKIFKSLANDPEVKSGGKGEFSRKWASYAQIENISAISGDDLEITRDGGNMTISATYQKKVPLFKNVSLLIDFSPTSASGP